MQKELSQMTGIQESTLSFLARNRRDKINTELLSKIMKALNITSFDEILELED
ncbi:helix-turn-helix domain-containing protein [Shimazuella kribbensis]|uniref:helix-turn-helix domain-containing protein n=1 Tax=Shimazuella kribbensis TaxID=139808 RepID=UPI001470EB22|nr:helix-turn-helix transcriptional regulator [Shimazuella kribbensis]